MREYIDIYIYIICIYTHILCDYESIHIQLPIILGSEIPRVAIATYLPKCAAR